MLLRNRGAFPITFPVPLALRFAMKTGSWIYIACRGMLRITLGFYFSRIVKFHSERIPDQGPLLFTSNHPNSLTDAFIIGASVRRKVHFVATVQLFRSRLSRWLLSEAGVIPINRVKDDPRAMRTVAQSFEACYRVLERGEAVGIFPEGITHDDPQLKAIKTGAARMALELESRHQGSLGLRIVPVGLTFSDKSRYRSDVLVHFGAPIQIADFLDGYAENRHERIRQLNAEIEHRIQDLILHVPRLERFRIVRAVRRLYQDRLDLATGALDNLAPSQVRDVHQTRMIARVVDFTFEHRPARATAFVDALNKYETLLAKLRLSEEEPWDLLPPRGSFWIGQALWVALGVLLAPIALYGGSHRWLPLKLMDFSTRGYRRADPRPTSISTMRIVSGLVCFTLCYAAFAVIVHLLFGWPVSLFYALSLPPAGLVAHYYSRELRRFRSGLRTTWLRLRAPHAVRRLLDLRTRLVSEIEAQRQELKVLERKVPA